MSVFEHLLNTFVFLFVIIDPIAAVPVFLFLTRGESLAHRHQTAKKSCLIALIVLVCFAFFGEKLLGLLTISTPALQIAGGLLLLIAAIEMVVVTHSGLTSVTDSEAKEGATKQDVSVFPLAIPLIAGPGAMTAVVMKMREIPSEPLLQIGIFLMIALVILLTYLCLRGADLITKILGVTGANVLARVFGIVLAGLAVQFMLNGLTMALTAL